MPWSDTEITSLVIPQGAGIGDPRIVIGPDIPQLLQDYADDLTSVTPYVVEWVCTIVWAVNSAQFSFDGIVSRAPDATPSVKSYFRLKGTSGTLGIFVMEVQTTALPATLLVGESDYWNSLSPVAPATIQYGPAALSLPSGGTWQFAQGVDLFYGLQPDGVTARSMGRGLAGLAYNRAGTLATSGGAEVAMANWNANSDSFVFRTGRIYKLTLQGGYFDAGAVGTPTQADINIRQTVNSIVAALLGSLRVGHSMGNNITSFRGAIYVQNATGSDIAASLGVTIQQNVGAAAVSIHGNIARPLTLTAEDVASTAYASLAAMATAL